MSPRTDVMPSSTDVMAAFDSAQAFEAATAALVLSGWRVVDRYTPFDIENARADHPVRPASLLPATALACGAAGGALAFLIQWWTNARSYPLNVGARPRPALPAYVPIVFESTILAAALGLVVAWLILLRLPRLWAPVDEIVGFEHAAIDRFWGRYARPAGMSLDAAEAALRTLAATHVDRIEGTP
jgi:hypothetical protein